MSFALPKNTGTEVNATTGTLTVAWPAHIAGDVGILFVTSSAGGTTETLSTAAGFALIGTATTGTGTAGTKVSAYWCRASSSAMASPVVAAGTDYKQGVIQTFEDVIASGSPIASFLTGTKAVASTTVDVPFPGTTEPRQTIIEVIAKDTDTSGNFLSSYNAYGHHFGTTRWFSNGTVSGGGGGMALLVSRGPASPLASGTALTVNLTSASINAMISIALKGKADSVAYLLYEGIDFSSDANDYVPVGTGITVSVNGSTISPLDWWRETTGVFTDPAEVRYTATGFTVGVSYTITGDFSGFAAAGTVQLGTVETGLGTATAVPTGTSARVSHTFTATATTHVIRFIADNGAADTDMLMYEWWIRYVPGVVHTVTGTSTATASSSGAAVLVRVATGSSTATASSSGAALLVRVATGTSTAAASSSGAAQMIAVATGTSTAAASSSGATVLITAVTGTSTATASSTGVAVRVGIVTGTSTATASSSGAAAAVAVLTGASVATASASGVVTSVLIVTGTSTATATSSGIFVETGGPATGTSTATATSSGLASMVIVTSGSAVATASASGVAVAVLLVTGTATATALASGVAIVTEGDITVVGWLEPSGWVGGLVLRARDGELAEQRWVGGAARRAFDGALEEPSWKGTGR